MIVCTILMLCNAMPEVYEREFRKYNFSKVVKTYETAEVEQGQDWEQKIKLSQMIYYISDNHIKKNLINEENGWNQEYEI